MCFEFTSDVLVDNVWSNKKVEAWEDKNNAYYNNCGFSKDEDDDDSILEMR